MRIVEFGFSSDQLDRCSSQGILEEKRRPLEREESRAPRTVSITTSSLRMHCTCS